MQGKAMKFGLALLFTAITAYAAHAQQYGISGSRNNGSQNSIGASPNTTYIGRRVNQDGSMTGGQYRSLPTNNAVGTTPQQNNTIPPTYAPNPPR
jgi:hypothetical protein